MSTSDTRTEQQLVQQVTFIQTAATSSNRAVITLFTDYNYFIDVVDPMPIHPWPLFSPAHFTSIKGATLVLVIHLLLWSNV